MNAALFRNLPEHPDFERFWLLYPRKVGKGAARLAFQRAMKKCDPEQIIAALRTYKFGDDPRFIPHPTTWLNGERWADQPYRKHSVGEAVEFDASRFHASVRPHLDALRARMGDKNVVAWLADAVLDGTQLRVPTSFKRDTIRERFADDLRDVLGVRQIVTA